MVLESNSRSHVVGIGIKRLVGNVENIEKAGKGRPSSEILVSNFFLSNKNYHILHRYINIG